MSDFRNQLLLIQKTIYRKEYREIHRSIAREPNIARYAREYQRYLNDYLDIASKEDVYRKVIGSDIVFHGDYHPLRQSQRSVLRILREVAPQRQVILLLEIFRADHQDYIDMFMSGRLTEKSFLRKIDFAKTWGYPWENWKPVIDLCRESGIAVIGINTPPNGRKESLYRRDLAAAKIIRRELIGHPRSLLYVVDGDYHVAPGHLPACVQRLCSPIGLTPKRTIIYQNDEKLYWRLAEQKLEEHDILRIAEDSFCIMSTTPVNKLQSYLDWLEYSREGFYPSTETGEGMPGDGGSTIIYDLVKTLCSLLQLPFPAGSLQRLTVYYGSNLDFLDSINSAAHFAPVRSIIMSKLRANEGFLIEYREQDQTNYCVYLPSSSLNMAAEEASHFINVTCRGWSAEHGDAFDRFYRNVLTETLGFFGSKLINEKRKAVTAGSLRECAQQVKAGTASGVQRRKAVICTMLLRHIALEKHATSAGEFKKRMPDLYRPRSYLFEIAGTQLGYITGNRLYYAVKNNYIPLSYVRTLYEDPLTSPGRAFERYMELSQHLRTLSRKNMLRNDVSPAHG